MGEGRGLGGFTNPSLGNYRFLPPPPPLHLKMYMKICSGAIFKTLSIKKKKFMFMLTNKHMLIILHLPSDRAGRVMLG